MHGYFADRAAPGVSIGASNVSGQDAAALRSTIASAVGSSSVVLKDDQGHRIQASLKDLGVNVDVDRSVERAIGTKSANPFSRMNPLTRQSSGLVATVDHETMSDYLTKHFLSPDDRAVAASVAWNDGQQAFAATEGRQGKSVRTDGVRDAVDALVANPGETRAVNVAYATVDAPVSHEAALAAAQQANARVSQALVVDGGQDESFTVPASVVAGWIKATPDTEQGTVTLSYDEQAARGYLAKQLPTAINRTMVSERTVNDHDGTVLAVLRQGVDGVKLENVDATIAKVLDALKGGTSDAIKANVKVTKHTTDKHVVRYDVPDGDPHMVVDLNRQTAYAYKGTTKVKTFPFSSGKQATPSDSGTFFVQVKYVKQTMRGGSGADAYVTPNVPWITYYNGDEGFHGAPWNPDGIAHGIPRSHGCLNMNVNDAKWVYDFLPLGSMVQVKGTTPTGPVR